MRLIFLVAVCECIPLFPFAAFVSFCLFLYLSCVYADFLCSGDVHDLANSKRFLFVLFYFAAFSSLDRHKVYAKNNTLTREEEKKITTIVFSWFESLSSHWEIPSNFCCCRFCLTVFVPLAKRFQNFVALNRAGNRETEREMSKRQLLKLSRLALTIWIGKTQRRQQSTTEKQNVE